MREFWQTLLVVLPPLIDWLRDRKEESRKALIAKINELDDAWNREDLSSILGAHRK